MGIDTGGSLVGAGTGGSLVGKATGDGSSAMSERKKYVRHFFSYRLLACMSLLFGVVGERVGAITGPGVSGTGVSGIRWLAVGDAVGFSTGCATGIGVGCETGAFVGEGFTKPSSSTSGAT